ncbi:Hypothetical predicted protein, partial [Paramuricea clavata]
NDRVAKVIEETVSQDVIDEHPPIEPAPWVSNAVIAPKPDGTIHITLDARNVNKAIQASNLPIPRQRILKQSSAGQTFSQRWISSLHSGKSSSIQIQDILQYSTRTTNCTGTRTYNASETAQGELNVALQPLFANIPQAHLIHDDLIVAAKNDVKHNKAIEEVMKAIFSAGITLNPNKCTFGASEIEFWGLRIVSSGVRSSSVKVDALNYISPPRSKEDLVSFLYMMQLNAEFIPNFAKQALKAATKTATVGTSGSGRLKQSIIHAPHHSGSRLYRLCKNCTVYKRRPNSCKDKGAHKSRVDLYSKDGGNRGALS